MKISYVDPLSVREPDPSSVVSNQILNHIISGSATPLMPYNPIDEGVVCITKSEVQRRLQ